MTTLAKLLESSINYIAHENSSKSLKVNNVDYVVFTDEDPEVGDRVFGGYLGGLNKEYDPAKITLFKTTRAVEVKFNCEYQGGKAYLVRTRSGSIVLVVVHAANNTYRITAEEALG